MQRQQIDRLRTIDRLISIKGTGTPKELGIKVGISERSLYLYLNLLRYMGAPIKYDTFRQTYYYEQRGSVSLTFLPTK